MKTKNIFLSLMIAVLVLPCLALFSACGEDKITDFRISGQKTEFVYDEDFTLGENFKAEKQINEKEWVEVESSDYTVNSSAYNKNELGSHDIIVTLNDTTFSASYSVTVEKIQTTFVAISDVSGVYGQTLSSIALPNGYSWVDGSHVLNMVTAPLGTAYDVIYCPSAVHEPVLGQVNVVVYQAAGVFAPIEPIQVTYSPDLTFESVILPIGYEWENPNALVGDATDLTGVEVNVIFTNGLNYTPVTGQVTVIVNKANTAFVELEEPLETTYSPTATLSSIQLPAGYEWADPTVLVGASTEPDYGTFDVYYTKNQNYNKVSGTIYVLVKKADATFANIATPFTVTYNETATLSSIILPQGYEWENPFELIGDATTASGKTFAALYAPDSNYNKAEGELTVVVNKIPAGSFVPLSEPFTADIGTTLADITLPAGYAWVAPETVLNEASAQGISYPCTYTASKNHESVSGTIQVIVNLLTPIINPQQPTQNLVFGDDMPVLVGLPTDTEGTYVWVGEPTLTAGSNFYLYQWIPENPYYKSMQGSIRLYVAPKTLEGATVTLEFTEAYYQNGEQIEPEVLSVVLAGEDEPLASIHYTVAYSNNTEVGTATVTVSGLGNYAGEATAIFTISDKIRTVEFAENKEYTLWSSDMSISQIDTKVYKKFEYRDEISDELVTTGYTIKTNLEETGATITLEQYLTTRYTEYFDQPLNFYAVYEGTNFFSTSYITITAREDGYDFATINTNGFQTIYETMEQLADFSVITIDVTLKSGKVVNHIYSADNHSSIANGTYRILTPTGFPHNTAGDYTISFELPYYDSEINNYVQVPLPVQVVSSLEITGYSIEAVGTYYQNIEKMSDIYLAITAHTSAGSYVCHYAYLTESVIIANAVKFYTDDQYAEETTFDNTSTSTQYFTFEYNYETIQGAITLVEEVLDLENSGIFLADGTRCETGGWNSLIPYKANPLEFFEDAVFTLAYNSGKTISYDIDSQDITITHHDETVTLEEIDTTDYTDGVAYTFSVLGIIVDFLIADPIPSVELDSITIRDGYTFKSYTLPDASLNEYDITISAENPDKWFGIQLETLAPSHLVMIQWNAILGGTYVSGTTGSNFNFNYHYQTDFYQYYKTLVVELIISTNDSVRTIIFNVNVECPVKEVYLNNELINFSEVMDINTFDTEDTLRFVLNENFKMKIDGTEMTSFKCLDVMDSEYSQINIEFYKIVDDEETEEIINSFVIYVEDKIIKSLFINGKSLEIDESGEVNYYATANDQELSVYVNESALANYDIYYTLQDGSNKDWTSLPLVLDYSNKDITEINIYHYRGDGGIDRLVKINVFKYSFITSIEATCKSLDDNETYSLSAMRMNIQDVDYVLQKEINDVVLSLTTTLQAGLSGYTVKYQEEDGSPFDFTQLGMRIVYIVVCDDEETELETVKLLINFGILGLQYNLDIFEEGVWEYVETVGYMTSVYYIFATNANYLGAQELKLQSFYGTFVLPENAEYIDVGQADYFSTTATYILEIGNKIYTYEIEIAYNGSKSFSEIGISNFALKYEVAHNGGLVNANSNQVFVDLPPYLTAEMIKAGLLVETTNPEEYYSYDVDGNFLICEYSIPQGETYTSVVYIKFETQPTESTELKTIALRSMIENETTLEELTIEQNNKDDLTDDTVSVEINQAKLLYVVAENAYQRLVVTFDDEVIAEGFEQVYAELTQAGEYVLNVLASNGTTCRTITITVIGEFLPTLTFEIGQETYVFDVDMSNGNATGDFKTIMIDEYTINYVAYIGEQELSEGKLEMNIAGLFADFLVDNTGTAITTLENYEATVLNDGTNNYVSFGVSNELTGGEMNISIILYLCVEVFPISLFINDVEFAIECTAVDFGDFEIVSTNPLTSVAYATYSELGLTSESTYALVDLAFNTLEGYTLIYQDYDDPEGETTLGSQASYEDKKFIIANISEGMKGIMFAVNAFFQGQPFEVLCAIILQEA